MTDVIERRRPAPEADRRGRGHPPRIDPRIAQRWVDARRQEGRKRLRIVAVVASIVVVAALAAGSLYTPIFAVNHVRVSIAGPATVGVARIESEAGLTHHPLMIHVSPAAIAARLDADPLLGQAQVAKHWPGTVTVAVTERTPLAQVAVSPVLAGQAQTYVPVDPTGRVLGPPAAQIPGLPVVQGGSGAAPAPAPGRWLPGSPGPDASYGGTAPVVDVNAVSDGPDVPRGAAAALAFLQALPQPVRAQVQTLTAGPGPDITLVVVGAATAGASPAPQITVELGDGSQLAAKATALQAILTQAPLTGVSSLDLSVPDRPATSSAPAN